MRSAEEFHLVLVLQKSESIYKCPIDTEREHKENGDYDLKPVATADHLDGFVIANAWSRAQVESLSTRDALLAWRRRSLCS